MLDSLSYAALEERRRLGEHTEGTVDNQAAIVWRREEKIYLLFKDESHGESDSLEQQQHAENAEELQRGGKEARVEGPMSKIRDEDISVKESLHSHC